jgi:hypothetical protein
VTVSAGSKARLEALKQLLGDISRRILPDVAFELWDKSTVPADLAPDALLFAIADEGAIARTTRF